MIHIRLKWPASFFADGERDSVITILTSSKMSVSAARAGNMDFQSAKVGMRTLGREEWAVEEATGRRWVGEGKWGGMSCRQAPATSTQRIRRRSFGLLESVSRPPRSSIMLFSPSMWTAQVA